jgi:hypothetical protein
VSKETLDLFVTMRILRQFLAGKYRTLSLCGKLVQAALNRFIQEISGTGRESRRDDFSFRMARYGASVGGDATRLLHRGYICRLALLSPRAQAQVAKLHSGRELAETGP